MIKFPLHTQVILLTEGGIFSCIITHAGQDIVTCENIQRLNEDPTSNISYFISNKIYFKREKIIGYGYVEDRITPEAHINQSNQRKFKKQNNISEFTKEIDNE